MTRTSALWRQSGVRTLATAAAQPPTSPHRPRLDALRKEMLEIDDFVGEHDPAAQAAGEGSEKKQQERILLGTSRSST